MDEGIFLSQSTYARNLVKIFEMQTSKTTHTPMSTTSKMSKYEDEKRVDERLYQAMIGSLLYLTTSRPNISHNVGVCARYQASPHKSYMAAVIRIIKYARILTRILQIFVMQIGLEASMIGRAPLVVVSSWAIT